jgi:pilus assembly protein CpaB
VTLFRTVFLTLSRIPPMLMLAVIVGLALAVSYMTMMLNEDKNQIEALRVQNKALKASNAAKSRVVYALKDIPEGTEISSSDLQEREIETTKVPDDAIVSSELATGRTAKYGIPAGQMVSQHELRAADCLEHPVLREGMRAISFGVDTNAGVAGFVSPGSYVDILAILGSGAAMKAQPILSDVEVLRIGQHGEKQVGPRACNSVTSFTVALAPTDVRKLATALAVGKLYLTLRREGDHTPVAIVDINKLFDRHERR